MNNNQMLRIEKKKEKITMNMLENYEKYTLRLLITNVFLVELLRLTMDFFKVGEIAWGIFGALITLIILYREHKLELKTIDSIKTEMMKFWHYIELVADHPELDMIGEEQQHIPRID